MANNVVRPHTLSSPTAYAVADASVATVPVGSEFRVNNFTSGNHLPLELSVCRIG